MNTKNPMTRTEWKTLVENSSESTLGYQFQAVTQRAKDMTDPTKSRIKPGYVTPLYCSAYMTQCEIQREQLNGDGSYELKLSDENLFEGKLVSNQHLNATMNGKIVVTWKGCACQCHDGGLSLSEIVKGESVVTVEMTDHETTTIVGGQLKTGSWPFFLTVRVLP